MELINFKFLSTVPTVLKRFICLSFLTVFIVVLPHL
jgi:hypothetical protein